MRQVDPVTARKGQFLESFELGEEDQMRRFCARAERMFATAGKKGDVVYTKVIGWGKGRRATTWQVYFLKGLSLSC